MPAVVSDVLQTRLELVGMGAYSNGLTQAAGALGLLDAKLDQSQRKALNWGIGTGAAAAGVAAALARATMAAGRLEQTQIGFQSNRRDLRKLGIAIPAPLRRWIHACGGE